MCLTDVLTPFTTPFTTPFAFVSASATWMVPRPAYLEELKRTLLPSPVSCEGSRCEDCGAPTLLTDTPMDFYDYDNVSDEYCESCEDQDAYNEYIDAMLDQDYDW